MNRDHVETRNRDKLRDALELIPDAMIILDQSARILMANDHVESLTAYKPQELLGRPLTGFLKDPFVHLFEEHHERALSTAFLHPREACLELECIRKDGRAQPIELCMGWMDGFNGAYLSCTLRDLAGRRETAGEKSTYLIIQSTVASILRLSLEPVPLEEILHRSLEELFSVPWIALQSKGAVFLAEGDPPVLHMKAQIGLSPSLLTACKQIPVGRCLCGRAASNNRIVFTSAVDQLHETVHAGMKDHGHYCVPIRSSNRLEGVLNLYVEAGHERKPEEEAFLLSVADVLAGTIRRFRAEEALRKSEERFALAIKGTNAGIWDWDLRTDEVYFSPRWKSMLGFEEDEINSSFAEWENRLHPQDRHMAYARLQRYLQGRDKEYELEHRLRHKDGTYRWILARGAAVCDDQGMAFRMVGSHIDITERKEIEKSLRQKEAQLLAAQDIQHHFLPKRSPPLPGYDLAGATFPAGITAGDLFDYIFMPDRSLGMVIGDVSGHGLGPALVMASTHAYLHSLTETSLDAGDILSRTNSLLMREIDTDMFVTALFGRLIPEERTFLYASAGHPAGFLLDRRGALKRELQKTAIPLGIMADAEYPMAEPIPLQEGDLMVLLTDGILEARSPEGEFFGPDRTLDAIRDAMNGTAREIVDHLYHKARAFSRKDKPDDDLTLVVLKVQSPGLNTRSGE